MKTSGNRQMTCFEIKFVMCCTTVFHPCISQFSMNRHEKYLCTHVHQSYGLALNMLKFASYLQNNLSVHLSKGFKFTKTVFVRLSKQNHAMALRLMVDWCKKQGIFCKGKRVIKNSNLAQLLAKSSLIIMFMRKK